MIDMISERKHTFPGHAQGYLCHLINLHAGEEFSAVISWSQSCDVCWGLFFVFVFRARLWLGCLFFFSP